MKHRGKAVVFETIEDYHTHLNDPSTEVDESSVLVLKTVGPENLSGYGRSRKHGITTQAS